MQILAHSCDLGHSRCPEVSIARPETFLAPLPSALPGLLRRWRCQVPEQRLALCLSSSGLPAELPKPGWKRQELFTHLLLCRGGWAIAGKHFICCASSLELSEKLYYFWSPTY